MNVPVPKEVLEFLQGFEKDAQRYTKLCTYLVGPRTDLDDALLTCQSKEDLDKVIDWGCLGD